MGTAIGDSLLLFSPCLIPKSGYWVWATLIISRALLETSNMVGNERYKRSLIFNI